MSRSTFETIKQIQKQGLSISVIGDNSALASDPTVSKEACTKPIANTDNNPKILPRPSAAVENKSMPAASDARQAANQTTFPKVVTPNNRNNVSSTVPDIRTLGSQGRANPLELKNPSAASQSHFSPSHHTQNVNQPLLKNTPQSARFAQEAKNTPRSTGVVITEMSDPPNINHRNPLERVMVTSPPPDPKHQMNRTPQYKVPVPRQIGRTVNPKINVAQGTKFETNSTQGVKITEVSSEPTENNKLVPYVQNRFVQRTSETPVVNAFRTSSASGTKPPQQGSTNFARNVQNVANVPWSESVTSSNVQYTTIDSNQRQFRKEQMDFFDDDEEDEMNYEISNSIPAPKRVVMKRSRIVSTPYPKKQCPQQSLNIVYDDEEDDDLTDIGSDDGILKNETISRVPPQTGLTITPVVPKVVQARPTTGKPNVPVKLVVICPKCKQYSVRFTSCIHCDAVIPKNSQKYQLKTPYMSSPPAMVISKTVEQKIVYNFTNGPNFSGFEQTVESMKTPLKRGRPRRLKEPVILTLSSDDDEHMEENISSPEFLVNSPQKLPRGGQKIIHDTDDFPGVTTIIHHNPRPSALPPNARTPQRVIGQDFRVLEPDMDEEDFIGMPNDDEEEEEEEYPEFDYPEEEDDEDIAEMSLLNRNRNFIDEEVFEVGEVPTRPMQYSPNALYCRSIRVGSYKILPHSNDKDATVHVQLLPNGFMFECVGTNFGDIIIKASDIKMCHLFSGKTLPVLFIDTTPEFAEKVRSKLTLTNNDCDQFRFDPVNKDPFVRKITFLASVITQHQVTFLRECFPGSRLIQELSQKAANNMLVASTQTEKDIEMLLQRRNAAFSKRVITNTPQKATLTVQPRATPTVQQRGTATVQQKLATTVQQKATSAVQQKAATTTVLPAVVENEGSILKLTASPVLKKVIIPGVVESNDNVLKFNLPPGTTLTSTSSPVSSTTRAAASVEPVVKLLTYPPPPDVGGVTITNADLLCLREGEFLNDAIIDFYLRYIYNEVISEEFKEKTHIFSSYFYPRLTHRPERAKLGDDDKSLQSRRHSQVKSWTKRVDIFTKDYIVVPVNQNVHWFLAIICFPGKVTDTPVTVIKTEPMDPDEAPKEETEELPPTKNENVEPEATKEDIDTSSMEKAEPEASTSAAQVPDSTTQSQEIRQQEMPCICLFDSLGGPNRWRVLNALREYVEMEWKMRKGTTKIFDKDTMKGFIIKCPQQNNYSDCGLYVLQYVQSFFENPFPYFGSPMPDLTEWFTADQVSSKRQELKEMIMAIHLEQLTNKGTPNSVSKKSDSETAKPPVSKS